ncbi:uncharacterized protein LOC129583020 [Paramacrobiotus metropolitanus]|uniref:uncharacterized protein LOC129583020 n=1 Tax=Paramacrobiotus metropolitanus TaxID=2943436 RepID=UPI0024458BA9|nr:uncharacterized protein LOC129583020 [Paramacrobiotus metropolitanus]
MTFATVSPQGALLRPCSPSSPSNRNRQLHFHVSTQTTSGAGVVVVPTASTSHSHSHPLISILPTSVTLQSIPRSHSGQYYAPSAAILLHPDPRQNPPPSILILPGSARSRIREHQSALNSAKSTAEAGQVTKESPPRSARSNGKMAAAVASPGSSTHTPQHHSAGYYSQTLSHQTHFHYSDRAASPTVQVTTANGVGQHFTPPRLIPQTVTSGQNVIQIRTVQKPIEALLVDGDNPFKPEGKLYKEAEDEIQQYIRPLSAAPSPLPNEPEPHLDPVELDKEFPLLVHHHHAHPHHHDNQHVIQPQTSTSGSSTKEDRSKSTSSTSSAGPPGPEVPATPDSDTGKENVAPVVTPPPTVVRDVVDQRPTEGKTIVRDVEPAHPREVERERGEPSSNGKGSKKDAKKEKKKRKPVGCGGDKSCSIM